MKNKNSSDNGRIVLTGGGTGGHITPLLAVASELKRKAPGKKIIYIGERRAKFKKMVEGTINFDESYAIFAGKFRRYHGESLLRRLFDLKTNLLNIRDFFYFGLGTIQSIWLIKKIKPQAVLLKGGFVGVPVGLACAFWRIPFITHDSDAVPGLANRLVSRWAVLHATALSSESYEYPTQKTIQTGVLVDDAYEFVTKELQAQYKQRLGIPANNKLLLITGGSGGAASINEAMRSFIDELLASEPDLFVVHQTGVGKKYIYDDYNHERLRVEELLFPLFEYTGASDLIISRAGANTIAEIGIQGRACILVPNQELTSGHQLMNAKYLQNSKAVEVVDNKKMTKNSRLLFKKITYLLNDESARQKLGENINRATISDATKRLATLLLEVNNDDKKNV